MLKSKVGGDGEERMKEEDKERKEEPVNFFKPIRKFILFLCTND